MKFKVTYEHEIVITYEGFIEADSEEEAREKVHECDLEEEQEINYQGMEIRIKEIEEV